MAESERLIRSFAYLLPDHARIVVHAWLDEGLREHGSVATLLQKRTALERMDPNHAMRIDRDDILIAIFRQGLLAPGEGDIRRSIIEADLVDCMVALPGQLFYSTQIPVCLWFLTRDKNTKGFRDCRGETLFIDARKLGAMIDRVHRELTDEEIKRLADTYHAWQGNPRDTKLKTADYRDIPGFCRSATKAEIAEHGYVLTPGRYVGAEEVEDDDEPFEDKMQRLTHQLHEQFAESSRLEAAIRSNLEGLGYGG